VVFIDYEMPVMNGVEATRLIRQDRGHQPLIFGFTNREESHRECLDSGMDDFVPKPFGREKVLQVLERWKTVMIDYQSFPNLDR
jgi:CheY-like chemotaxis protein